MLCHTVAPRNMRQIVVVDSIETDVRALSLEKPDASTTLRIPCPGRAHTQGTMHDRSNLHLAVCRSYDLVRGRV